MGISLFCSHKKKERKELLIHYTQIQKKFFLKKSNFLSKDIYSQIVPWFITRNILNQGITRGIPLLRGESEGSL